MPYRPRHARPSPLTGPRTLATGALVLGLATLVAVLAGETAGAGAAEPHAAAVPQVQQAVDDTSTSAVVQELSTLATSAASSTASRSAAPHDTTPASVLAGDGIPVTALTAYQQAAAREAQQAPECGLSWPLLAAIGRVESDHGRFAGAVLHADGLSTPRVIGIALDGHSTALIRDTDRGRLDGDLVYDRAVGPMQFIPSTWSVWGVDANNDGRADPFNIFDAAAAAGDYLCAAGGDLTTTRGQLRAIYSYNHSTDYVELVMRLERLYASGAGIVVPVAADPARARHVPAPTLPPVDPGTPRGTVSAPSTAPSASTSTSRLPTPTATATSTAASQSTTESTSAAPSSDSPTPTPTSDTATASDTPTPDPTSASTSVPTPATTDVTTAP